MEFTTSYRIITRTQLRWVSRLTVSISLSPAALLTQDYLADVYTDAMDDYLGGIIQVKHLEI